MTLADDLNGMIDSHFHSLEMDKKGIKPAKALESAFANGLSAAVDIGLSIEAFEKQKALTAAFPQVYYTLGLYPGNAGHPASLKNLDLLESYAASGDILAIGECGLDYYWMYSTKDEQKDLFISQIAIANCCNLPIIVHNREGDDDTLDVLAHHPPGAGGVMHCYSSDAAYAKKVIDIGMYISFAGNVTYNNAYPLQETAKKIPLSSIIIETDAPYLAPVPIRCKPCTPGAVQHTYKFIAELRNMHMNDLIAGVRDNFVNLFQINLRE